jgi:hypothetical protein
MASLDFDLPAIKAGTTFVFGSWVGIANGSGCFDSYLANTMNTEAPRQEQLDEAVSVEFLLPELADEIKKLFVLADLAIRSAKLLPVCVDFVEVLRLLHKDEPFVRRFMQLHCRLPSALHRRATEVPQPRV